MRASTSSGSKARDKARARPTRAVSPARRPSPRVQLGHIVRVDVEHLDGGALAVGPGAELRAGDDEAASVGQTGEPVGQRHALDAGAQFLDDPGRLGPRSDVAEDAQRHHRPVGVGEEAALHGQVDDATVGPAQPGLPDADACAVPLGQPVLELRVVGVVDQRGPAPPADFRLGHGEHAAGRRVGCVHLAVERRDDDALGGALEEDAVGREPE